MSKKRRPTYHYITNIQAYYEDARISSPIRLLHYLYINYESNKQMYFTNEYIANRLNMNIHTVKYALAALRQEKLIYTESTFIPKFAKSKRVITLNMTLITEIFTNFNWHQKGLTIRLKKLLRYRVISFVAAKYKKKYNQFIARQKLHEILKHHVTKDKIVKDKNIIKGSTNNLAPPGPEVMDLFNNVINNPSDIKITSNKESITIEVSDDDLNKLKNQFKQINESNLSNNY